MKSLIASAVVGLCAFAGAGLGISAAVSSSAVASTAVLSGSPRRGQRCRDDGLPTGARPRQPRRSVPLRHYALPPSVLQLETTSAVLTLAPPFAVPWRPPSPSSRPRCQGEAWLH